MRVGHSRGYDFYHLPLYTIGIASALDFQNDRTKYTHGTWEEEVVTSRPPLLEALVLVHLAVVAVAHPLVRVEEVGSLVAAAAAYPVALHMDQAEEVAGAVADVVVAGEVDHPFLSMDQSHMVH